MTPCPVGSGESHERFARPGIVRSYGDYCGALLKHYQAAFAQLRLVDLTLTGEGLRTRPLPVPVRSTPSPQREESARSYSAARGLFS